jgi:chromosome partitioning protein
MYLFPLYDRPKWIWMSYHIHALFYRSKDFNESVRGYLVLNMTPTNMFVNEANQAADVLKDFPEMNLSNARVCDRKAHRDGPNQ